MQFDYVPRNDNVLVERVRPGKVGDLVVPDKSETGNWWRILAVGAKYTGDLKPRMRVVVGALPGGGLVFPIPGETEIYVVDQKCVLAIAQENPDGSA